MILSARILQIRERPRPINKLIIVIWYNQGMDVQSQQRLLREQQVAYRKLNEWEFKERQQKLPDLSIDDALRQYFQLIALSKMTADNHQPTNEIAQIERWQWRANLMRILKN